jgi:hypothetical protein
MILNLPDSQIEFSANIFYWLLCEAMNNKRLPGDNYKGDTQKLTQTHLFYDLNALMNVEAVSLGKFDLLYHEGRLQGGYKNAASKFKSGSFKSASSSIFLLNDGDMVAGFDTQVKTDYAAAYKKATEFARRYFDCAASARNDALVQKTLYLISTDSSISATQPFYICSDGSAKTKDDLGSMIDFEFEAFLLVVWHFLLTSQRLQADLKNVDSEQNQELIKRMLGTLGIEVYHAYLPELSTIYTPVTSVPSNYAALNRIAYFDITKWVLDAQENYLDKLVNVYHVLSQEECTIALIFHRTMTSCQVTMAVVRTCPHRNSCTSFRQILPVTALKILEGRQPVGGFLPCHRQNYA